VYKLILARSAIAALFLPYTSLHSLESDSAQSQFSSIALNHVQDAVSRIARSTEILAYNSNTNDIPLAM
jgi:hypothetical protein